LDRFSGRCCVRSGVLEIAQQPHNNANTNGRRRHLVEIRQPTAILVRDCPTVLRDRCTARRYLLDVFRSCPMTCERRTKLWFVIGPEDSSHRDPCGKMDSGSAPYGASRNDETFSYDEISIRLPSGSRQ